MLQTTKSFIGVRPLLVSVLLSLTAESRNQNAVSCFWMPPATRLALNQEESLQRDCQIFITQNVGHSKDCSMCWEPSAREGYQVAKSLFDKIAQGRLDDSSSNLDKPKYEVAVFFPRWSDQTIQRLQLLADVINANSEELGCVQAICLAWPSAPCTVVKLCWDKNPNKINKIEPISTSNWESAVADTQDWVENTLCRLRLCPYTASIERAAVGLEVAHVSEGSIGIRHSLSPFAQKEDFGGYPEVGATVKVGFTATSTPAAALASAFWNGVSELATRPEQDVATLLIVAPPTYDGDFVAFYQICDNLIEPMVQAVRAQGLVGRAWFHPKYEASLVHHTTILPGHALPAAMVESFVETYYSDPKKSTSSLPTLDGAAIAKANDMVRWTPHATINLLRRSQLTAAKQVEANLPNQRPNFVYARNVIRILQESSVPSAKSKI